MSVSYMDNVLISISNLLDENSILYNVDDRFWNSIICGDEAKYVERIEKILHVYGTSLPCNRFDVGNMIEYCIADYVKDIEYNVKETPNAKRYDLTIDEIGHISIKYCSGTIVILHNSQGQNKDMDMKDTFLITPKEWWLLKPSIIQEMGIKLEDYLVNRSDSLSLNLKLLTVLKKKQYKYWLSCTIQHDKQKCLHRPCSRDLYRYLFENEQFTLH